MSLKFQVQIAKQGNTFISIDHFEIPQGKITFLFGESGIGKTMISKAVYGLLDPAVLDIRINNMDYPAYLQQAFTRRIQETGFFVFQEPSTHLNPLLKLGDQIREGSLRGAPYERDILRHLWDGERDETIRKILEVYPKPYRPSGAEKQRILLAMAFKKISLMQAQQTKPDDSLFVFDEPTGNLDNNFRNLFLQLLLEKFRRFPFSAIFITHDYSIISEIYNNHTDLRERIAFRELSLKEEGLILQDFAPRAYLEWLKAEKPVSSFRNRGQENVLKIHGGYEVFGKKMIISRDQTRKNYGMLQIHRGEMVYLKAASGAGKTTLAKVIMGLQDCKNLEMVIGRWKFTGKTPKTAWRYHIWGEKIGMVFQHADEALNLNSTVKEVFKGLPGSRKKTAEDIRQRLQEMFDFPVTGSFLKKKVALLSGGQKQRLNLLRTLILDTDLIILDEPLNGLDFVSIKKVIAALQTKQQEGKAILMISHNEEIFDALVPPESVYYLYGD
jgi:ABC-type glutathione transport system ATPase component